VNHQTRRWGRSVVTGVACCLIFLLFAGCDQKEVALEVTVDAGSAVAPAMVDPVSDQLAKSKNMRQQATPVTTDRPHLLV
jgi:hypothetical protein